MADSPATPPTPGSRAGRATARPTDQQRRVVRMGKYEVVQHIATGGMGAVYRARDTESNGEVALKVLQPELAAKPAMLERFRREARSADKLNHENIVRQFEFGEIGGTYFLVMEFVDGIDLHDHIKNNGPLDPEEARYFILQGARALRHAHDQNIVHRDIKPSNFLLTSKNNRPLVKLADFGLAREVDADEFRVTRAGTTVGTVDYMSPEQARDSGSADIRSDLYSLGSTWYHLLTGHAPFNEGGLGERLIKIMHEEPPDVREINPRVSAECWEVIHRLLAKEPDDRYQTPALLIDDLLTLEGRTTVKVKPRSDRIAKKKSSRKKESTQSEAKAPATVADAGSRKLWYVAGTIGAAILLGVIVLVLGNRRSVPPTGQPVAIDPAANPNDVTTRPGDPPTDDKDKGRPPVKPTDPVVPAIKALPFLTTTVKAIDPKELRAEIEKPWAGEKPVAADAVVFRISRAAAATPTSFRSLAEACARAPAGKPVVLEIHDNGPLFETSPGRLSGRDVVLRAGKGYRPLIIWDIPGLLARQPGKADQPLVFLGVDKGRLFVEGIEFAWRWPDTLERPAILFDARDSDLSVRGCGISAAGKPRKGVVLGRFQATRENALCRWTRCQGRGTGIIGLEVDAPAAEVLIDGCLLVGGPMPLLSTRAGEKGPRLRVARSTLVCGKTLLEVKPSGPLKTPSLSWLGWDSLFSRSETGLGGSLVALGDGIETRSMEWRAYNCLYAGFGNLLSGATTVGDDIRDWQKHWARVESDGVVRDTWPEQVYSQPSTQPASSYAPRGAVRFASTVAVDKPLGCDLAALPANRDGWVTLAFEPLLGAPDLPADDSAPEIPQLDDGKFHGGMVNLDEIDLGDYLARVQKMVKLGPKVVLHLTGKGDRQTTPISIKGSSLVLHFEEPADREKPRLALVFSRAARPVPLIDIEDGGIEVIGGVLRIPDTSSLRVSHVIRVTRGDVRLYRTRLDGPQQGVPEGYVAALAVAGSGDPTPEKGHACAINECSILSSQAGVTLSGVGCRLAMRQSVVVAGTEGIQVLPGRSCTGRTGISCSLASSTFACRRAVLRLGDAPASGLPTEPVVVNARDCTYLNPFPGRPSKAGLVLWEGDALARGLLLWQGEGEGYDPRLHFSTASASEVIPDLKEGVESWKTVWGSGGVRRSRTLQPRELAGLFGSRNWQFERLVLRGTNPPGANVERLGLLPRKVPR